MHPLLSAKGLEAKKQASSPKSPSKSSVGGTEGEESSPRTTDPTGRSEAGSPSRKRSRRPLKRKPFGNKQRKKFEKGQYGDQRVRFSNPLEVPGGGKGEAGGPPKGKKGKGKKGKAKGKGGSTRERRAKEEAEERAGADPLKGGLARVEDEAKGVWRDPWEHAALDGAGWCATCWRCRPGLGFRGEGTLSRHSAVGMHRISR